MKATYSDMTIRLRVLMGAVSFILVLSPACDRCFAENGSVQADGEKSATVSAHDRVEPAAKIAIEVSDETIDKELPSLRSHLKDIIREAEVNIKKMNEKIGRESDERSVKEHLEKGRALYRGGKAAEARTEWEEALKACGDPATRGHIKANLKMAERRIREEARKAVRPACITSVRAAEYRRKNPQKQ